MRNKAECLCSSTAMPFSTAAPQNKKKPNRIITDLSNISQNGKNPSKTEQKDTLHARSEVHHLHWDPILFLRKYHRPAWNSDCESVILSTFPRAFHMLSRTTEHKPSDTLNTLLIMSDMQKESLGEARDPPAKCRTVGNHFSSSALSSSTDHCTAK